MLSAPIKKTRATDLYVLKTVIKKFRVTYDLRKDIAITVLLLYYLIPIKIRAPLIFAHLACAKFKGSKIAQ